MTGKKPDFQGLNHSILETEFGNMVVVWSREFNRIIIIRILLSSPEQTAESKLNNIYPDSSRTLCREIGSLLEQILAFLAGNPVRFSMEEVSIDRCSDFQRKVLESEFAIPRGKVSTYQRIGTQLGIPNGARAVGNALATNPFPIVIPCHRAIRSDRTLGGYQGGTVMKRKLLELEGNGFDPTGRIINPRFFY
jgi:methylated-DNA-[protein]-cysteine S-methyltransferase